MCDDWAGEIFAYPIGMEKARPAVFDADRVGYLLDFIDLVEEDFDGIEYFFWIFQLRQVFRA